MAGWAAYGFNYNNYNQPNVFSVGDEVFNVVTKDGMAVIYLIGAVAPFRLKRQRDVPIAV